MLICSDVRKNNLDDDESVEFGGTEGTQELHYPLDVMLTCVRWYAPIRWACVIWKT